jgi:hypothetical protein
VKKIVLNPLNELHLDHNADDELWGTTLVGSEFLIVFLTVFIKKKLVLLCQGQRTAEVNFFIVPALFFLAQNHELMVHFFRHHVVFS